MKFGAKNWSYIAQALPGRIGKQCRERWHNHLSPLVDKNEWTEEEDKAIAEGVARMGPKCPRLQESYPPPKTVVSPIVHHGPSRVRRV